jgi:hypothetical protein
MAKSDLLKEAIADARAVKETALANAKIALQEAFAPRLERMLATELSNEMEDDEMPAEEPAMDDMGDDAGMEPGMEDDMGAGEDVGDLSIDVNNDGEFDEFDVFSKEEPGAGAGMEGGEEALASDEEMADEYNEGYNEDDLNLEAIIRELEGDLNEEEDMEDEKEDDMATEGYDMPEDEKIAEDFNIDEIIESILREEELEEDANDEMGAGDDGDNLRLKETQSELEEAYKTVRELKSIINEVNLLNAKLLYTNKLFRNFELSEGQKMKVIEGFDRAGNTREVKLVFSTLAESFNRPTKKRVVKESYASKPAASTAPKKETTQVLSEGFELANRWKKLAGLL